MKLLVLAGCLLCMILMEVRTNLVQASARPSFLVNPQDLEPYTYVTITGDTPKSFIYFFETTVMNLVDKSF